ncbi:MAG: chorismate mutase [Acidobacteria bacterium]|nr:chorismate mutase [Acidobacteriota bacterium]
MAGATAGKGGGRRAVARRGGPRAPADPLEERRRRIDAIDRRVVRLLNERAGQAIALGRIKKARGLPIYQPEREEDVLRNVQSCNGGPLESAALGRLFERIIDESRRIERIATSGANPDAAGPGGTRPAPPRPRRRSGEARD